MDSTLYSLLFFILCTGSILLLIFSVMAFCKVEGLEIDEGKHTKSGIILIIDAIIYGIIAFFLKRRTKSYKKLEEEKVHLIEMQNMNIEEEN